ncbi:hypothetical protein LMG3458_01113 [Achromobacter deleyi]|uniref:Uncharacterized protein n=1 Tax=Achromobacter deleyi TaxID=1353891 RepID=A0A6S6ZAZ8_9BURK|nr:hypothetical protein [Achromobacter deleyi]CAB3671405.1 hypothetical protein LMG3458_01113 [Achromobacter deleyi]CAB3840717.1 hypothetical protein LMG3481_01242 [Achromobacter deleyi]CAB3846035.1 hypothetical protein LMG3482_01523 [Achromobacter deleyi]
MTTLSDNAVRETAVYGLAPGAVARGQNFFVQWLEGRETPYPARSGHEMLLLLPDDGAQVRVGDGDWQAVPGRSVCVLPAGDAAVQLKPKVRAALLASSRPDLAQDGIANAADYAAPDPRIVAGDSGYRRMRGTGELQVIAIDAIRPPADKPRLKMLQTETLSINWVEYQGARDRSSLSPHSHADFEQGSLAIDGHFIHHLRVQWGPDADQWRDDLHLQAGPASMMTIPVQMIHTTEGVGPGRHLLIDVFSPPRQDFIGKGWVANAADYSRP